MTQELLRWFCVYRAHNYKEQGVAIERTVGGRNLRCYHDLEVVRRCARKWMPAQPAARAFIYEVFSLEGDPPIGCGPWAVTADGPDARAARWRWTRTGRRTRLVLLEELRHPEEYVVRLTEELVSRRALSSFP